MRIMRDVTIRSRADGIIELAPKLAPLEAGDRLMVIVTVLLVTGGLFLCGAVPAPVAGALVVSCVAGEVVLGLKAAALVLLRPVAQVLEVPRFARRRGR
jgi:hypothetical protein